MDQAKSEPAVRVIQVASADRTVREAVRPAVEEAGWEVVETTEALTTMALAASCRPGLLVLDARDARAASQTVKELRIDFRTMLLPVLFVTEGEPGEDLMEVFGGSDDYLVAPLESAEVATRIRLCMRRQEASRSASPLTGLPGNVVIREELSRRLGSGRPFALLHADMDSFKEYNDRYGFERGDRLISFLADVVTESLEAEAGGPCFAGHVGGDDFVALVDPDAAESVARRMVGLFDGGVARAYDADDAGRGWVEVTDRRGNTLRAPICSVSVGIVFSARGFESPAEMAEAAAEVKGVAKRSEGSAWAADRRRS